MSEGDILIHPSGVSRQAIIQAALVAMSGHPVVIYGVNQAAARVALSNVRKRAVKVPPGHPLRLLVDPELVVETEAVEVHRRNGDVVRGLLVRAVPSGGCATVAEVADAEVLEPEPEAVESPATAPAPAPVADVFDPEPEPEAAAPAGRSPDLGSIKVPDLDLDLDLDLEF